MTPLKWAALGLAAAVAGALAAKPVVAWTVEHTAVRNGPWRTSPDTGGAGANPYVRAAIAVAGLYALAADETIYYTAFVDDAGAPLDGRCDYALSGHPLPARWWSVTAYGADHYLVDNAANIYSRHAGNLESGADGSYEIALSSQPQARNWLPAPASGVFSVTLRLYNPGTEVYRAPATVPLPSLRRLGCR